MRETLRGGSTRNRGSTVMARFCKISEQRSGNPGATPCLTAGSHNIGFARVRTNLTTALNFEVTMASCNPYKPGGGTTARQSDAWHPSWPSLHSQTNRSVKTSFKRASFFLACGSHPITQLESTIEFRQFRGTLNHSLTFLFRDKTRQTGVSSGFLGRARIE